MDGLVLQEHSTRELGHGALSLEEATVLQRRYSPYVDLTRLWGETGRRWRLKAAGYVGILPLTEHRALHLQPKGAVANVFRMLDAVGDLPDVPAEVVEAETFSGQLEPLVRLLANQVNTRAQQGLYREHVRQERDVQYVRGRIDVDEHLRAPHRPRVPCRFDEHNADIEDNRILAWTLHRLARSGIGSDETDALVRTAFRRLAGRVRLVPMQPQDCTGRFYNRLNEDYRPMHAICRFLLSHMTPGYQQGEHATVPFVVDMPDLFVRFVGEILRGRIEEDSVIDTAVAETYALARFEPDLVLRDRATGDPQSVLDVKYKYGGTPTSADVQQVVAYATALGCSKAALVYPDTALAGQTAKIGEVRVGTLAVPLTSDLGERTMVVGSAGPLLNTEMSDQPENRSHQNRGR